MEGAPICLKTFASARAEARSKMLPENPDLLAGYHRAADELLAMLASRVEPDWEKAEAVLAEIDRLIAFQASIMASVAVRPANCLRDVLAKLSLWSAARSAREREDTVPEDELVASALRDLRRLLAAA